MRDLVDVALHDARGIRVGGIHQQLGLHVVATRQVAAEVSGNNEHPARGVGGERLLRLPVGGPGDDVERERGAKCIRETGRGGRRIQILNHQRQAVNRQRDGVAEQKQENQREQQRQRQRHAVAKQLNQFFAGLR